MVINFVLNLLKGYQPYFNSVVSALILLLAIYAYMRYDMSLLGTIKSSLYRVNHSLEDIKGYDLNNIKQIDCIFEDKLHPSLKEGWRIYYEDFKNMPIKDISLDIREYFNIDTVITIPGCRNKVQGIATILTTIGLLGTVLSMAITLINSDIAIGVGLTNGLGSLAEAFIIAITAILSSIAFQILDKQAYHKAMKELYRFHTLVRGRIPMTNEALSLERMAKEHKNQREVLEKLGQSISMNLSYLINHKIVPSIYQTFESAIHSELIPSIDRMTEVIEKVANMTIKNQNREMKLLVDSFMKELNRQLGNQFQLLAKSVNDYSTIHANMKNTVDAFLKGINQSMGAQSRISEVTEDMTKTISKSQSQILQMSKATEENLKRVCETLRLLTEMSISNEEILLKINEERVALQEENNGYFDKINSQMYKLQDDLHTEIESIFSRFTGIMGDTFEKLEQNTKDIMEGLSQHSQTVLTNMDEQVFNIGLSSKEINQEVRELNTTLESSLKIFNEQMNAGIMETFRAFDTGLGDICNRFNGTIIAIRESIEDLPIVIEQFKDELSGERAL